MLQTSPVTLTSANGAAVPIRIPPPGPGPSAFVFSIYKAGGTLLNNLVVELARLAGRPCINIPHAFFNAGVPGFITYQSDLSAAISKHGYIFTGFRQCGTCFDSIKLAPSPKLAIVRDPRDVLVSYYFSAALSHLLPAGGEARQELLDRRAKANAYGIDAFVLSDETDQIRRSYDDLITLSPPNLTVYRYEDVIFRKRWWVADICRALGLDVARKERWALARRHDIRPQRERPDLHIRQVAPGNFRQHLRPETIGEIERTYTRVFETYGYSQQSGTCGESPRR